MGYYENSPVQSAGDREKAVLEWTIDHLRSLSTRQHHHSIVPGYRSRYVKRARLPARRRRRVLGSTSERRQCLAEQLRLRRGKSIGAVRVISLSGPPVFVSFQIAVNQAQKREISVCSVIVLSALQ